MENITPSMRLKVKKDTYYVPDSDGGVYFRNNLCSFRMEGSSIIQWVEKLLPMFNGEYTLSDLTEGLSDPYRKRVYEIAEVLSRNGFVRDMSKDRTHDLSEQILKKHASQIEFLDSFGDSGAYRFQTYRQVKVLAVGSGPIFVSLVSALLESGLPKFHMHITDSLPTNRLRLSELVLHARKTDPDISVEEISLLTEGISSRQEILQEHDYVLYVSQEGDLEELRALHAICKENNQVFIPAICLQQVGLAGPLVNADSTGCWESAWRRLHNQMITKDQHFSTDSPIAGAMLANVIVFELFKEITRVSMSEQNNQFFLLDLEKMEGSWHSFIPHPLVIGHESPKLIQDLELHLEQSINKAVPADLLLYFGHLTSAQSGIFHLWEEGNLKQLPMAQCRIQAVDVLSDGPAKSLPEMIGTGLTHKDARREAGLVGIEAYVTQLAEQFVSNLSIQKRTEGHTVDLKQFVGIGAGETVAEGVSRGLQKCLEKELQLQLVTDEYSVSRVHLSVIEDEHCRYYLQALTTMEGSPIISLGEEVSGFPVVWVCINGKWFGSVDLNITSSLRNALKQALIRSQNKPTSYTTQGLEVSIIKIEQKEPLSIPIPKCEVITRSEDLKSAIQFLEKNRKRVLVYDLALEPFLQEGLAGVYGVLLREEESN